jgi:hypothetical protein
MKVRCIKTSFESFDDKIINSRMDSYLTVGNLFWVYGIHFAKSVSYLYIFNEEHLFEVPIGLFEVVDNSLSDEWKIKIWNEEEITLWPDLFYSDGFIENFAEREPNERKSFDILRTKIERKKVNLI